MKALKAIILIPLLKNKSKVSKVFLVVFGDIHKKTYKAYLLMPPWISQ